jgi:hypothetical protein
MFICFTVRREPKKFENRWSRYWQRRKTTRTPKPSILQVLWTKRLTLHAQPLLAEGCRRLIARELNMNKETVRQILTEDLGIIKIPQIWCFESWQMTRNNVGFTLRVCEVLAKKYITKMDHPPYSPNLAPCEFWLFSKLKNPLKGQRFADIPDIQRNVTTLLRGILKNDFQDCFR